MAEQPYDPYIPSGSSGAGADRNAAHSGNQRTAALQAVGSFPFMPDVLIYCHGICCLPCRDEHTLFVALQCSLPLCNSSLPDEVTQNALHARTR